MVDGMMTSGVQEVPAEIHLIMNRDGPEIHKRKQYDKLNVMDRVDEGNQVVRHALAKSVTWVERMGRERCGVFVGVMEFMDILVDHWVVEATMENIYQTIRERKKEDGGEDNFFPATCFFRDFKIYLAIPTVREDRGG